MQEHLEGLKTLVKVFPYHYVKLNDYFSTFKVFSTFDFQI